MSISLENPFLGCSSESIIIDAGKSTKAAHHGGRVVSRLLVPRLPQTQRSHRRRVPQREHPVLPRFPTCHAPKSSQRHPSQGTFLRRTHCWNRKGRSVTGWETIRVNNCGTADWPRVWSLFGGTQLPQLSLRSHEHQLFEFTFFHDSFRRRPSSFIKINRLPRQKRSTMAAHAVSTTLCSLTPLKDIPRVQEIYWEAKKNIRRRLAMRAYLQSIYKGKDKCILGRIEIRHWFHNCRTTRR